MLKLSQHMYHSKLPTGDKQNQGAADNKKQQRTEQQHNKKL
jgi:hypothetical protein